MFVFRLSVSQHGLHSDVCVVQFNRLDTACFIIRLHKKLQIGTKVKFIEQLDACLLVQLNGYRCMYVGTGE